MLAEEGVAQGQSIQEAEVVVLVVLEQMLQVLILVVMVALEWHLQLLVQVLVGLAVVVALLIQVELLAQELLAEETVEFQETLLPQQPIREEAEAVIVVEQQANLVVPA